jgi:hypothetical protein
VLDNVIKDLSNKRAILDQCAHGAPTKGAECITAHRKEATMHTWQAILAIIAVLLLALSAFPGASTRISLFNLGWAFAVLAFFLPAIWALG